MTHARRALWPAAAAILALTVGWRPRIAPAAEARIVFNLGAEPETLDPALATGVPEHRVMKSLFDGLTRLDADGAAQPGLAERWEANEDHTLYTFHLREAKWSNGDPVTAEDFVWSWRRVVDPATAADYAYQLYCLLGAESINAGKTRDFSTLGLKALDDRTLEVRLVGPTPYFPAMAALPTFYAVRRAVVAGSNEWHLRPETYVGNGPFRLVEWRHNDRIVVDKNPLYWEAGSVKLDRLVFRMIEAESTALAAFESGELDIVSTVPRPDIPRLRSRPEFHIAPFLGTYYVSFNCQRPPFDNPLVRKALTLAVDRKIIVERLTLGGEEAAFAWVPPSVLNAATGQSFRREKNAFFQDRDVEGARQALAQAGYPGGKGFPSVRYIYNTQESHKVIAEALQQMWAEALGVQIALENMEWKTYLEKRDSGDFDLARAGWIGDFLDPINFLDVFLSTSGNNNSHWINLQYDELLRRTKAAADLAERFRLMHEAEDMLMAELPICPIYYYTEPYLEKTYVRGVVRNALGWMDFTRAWIEKTARSPS